MTDGTDKPISGKGKHPNSLKNLKPLKPGHAPLPGGGRPKGALSLKERMDKYIDLDTKVVMPDGTVTDKSVMDSIVLALLSKARKGDVPAAKEILDRYYGKEAEKVELTGRDGKPLEIEHSRRLSEVYERAADAFGERPRISDEGPPAH